MKSFAMDPVDDFLKSKLNQPDFKPLTPYEAKIAQKYLEPIVAMIPEIVQYATVAKELRSHRNISLFWIDKRIKDLDWEKFEFGLSNATSED